MRYPDWHIADMGKANQLCKKDKAALRYILKRGNSFEMRRYTLSQDRMWERYPEFVEKGILSTGWR